MKKVLNVALLTLLALFVVRPELHADTSYSYAANATIGTNSKTVLEAYAVGGTSTATAISFKCGTAFLTATTVHKIYAAKETTDQRDFASMKVVGATNYGLTCPSGQTLYLDVGTGVPAGGSVNLITRP